MSSSSYGSANDAFMKKAMLTILGKPNDYPIFVELKTYELYDISKKKYHEIAQMINAVEVLKEEINGYEISLNRYINELKACIKKIEKSKKQKSLSKKKALNQIEIERNKKAQKQLDKIEHLKRKLEAFWIK